MKKSFELYLIEQCAPVLASIKLANLFCYPLDDGEEIDELLAMWQERIKSKGISIERLNRCNSGGNPLILLYRKQKLLASLEQPETISFLESIGYNDCKQIEDFFVILKKHFIQKEEFPHEIGVFLGYPLDDVKGFIENRGRNYSHCGCWKSYSNAQEAEKSFILYKKCSQVYKKLYQNGRDIMQMIVAA